MTLENATLNDYIVASLMAICVAFICVLAIQMKRLGRPDERSTAIRTHMLATVFISLLITVPLSIWFIPQEIIYRIFIPIAVSLLVGILSPKLYAKKQPLL